LFISIGTPLTHALGQHRLIKLEPIVFQTRNSGQLFEVKNVFVEDTTNTYIKNGQRTRLRTESVSNLLCPGFCEISRFALCQDIPFSSHFHPNAILFTVEKYVNPALVLVVID
jgi:hypothetical protein